MRRGCPETLAGGFHQDRREVIDDQTLHQARFLRIERFDRRLDGVGRLDHHATESNARLGHRHVREMPMQSHQQLSLAPCQLTQFLKHLLDERLLDAEELVLAEQHARDDLEAGADHAALVGGGVLEDERAGSEQLGARLGREEEIGALHDDRAGGSARVIEEFLPIAGVY